MVPVRVTPAGLAVAVKLTVPDLPSEELAVVAVSQFAKLTAVAEQPAVPVEKVNNPLAWPANSVVLVPLNM
jgi:hypothetical protein